MSDTASNHQNGSTPNIATVPVNSSGPARGHPVLDEEKKMEVIRGMSLQKIGNVRKVSIH